MHCSLPWALTEAESSHHGTTVSWAKNDPVSTASHLQRDRAKGDPRGLWFLQMKGTSSGRSFGAGTSTHQQQTSTRWPHGKHDGV